MLRIFLLGLLFGITLTMGEVISWFRIYEMFRFESFHMYGVIGSAVVLGAVFHVLVRRLGWTASEGRPLDIFRMSRSIGSLTSSAERSSAWAGRSPVPVRARSSSPSARATCPSSVAIAGALLGTLLYGICSAFGAFRIDPMPRSLRGVSFVKTLAHTFEDLSLLIRQGQSPCTHAPFLIPAPARRVWRGGRRGHL